MNLINWSRLPQGFVCSKEGKKRRDTRLTSLDIVKDVRCSTLNEMKAPTPADKLDSREEVMDPAAAPPDWSAKNRQKVKERKVYSTGYLKIQFHLNLCKNKTGTSKVGAISKAQKRKVFKIVKGNLLGFLKLQFAAHYQKNEGGILRRQKKSKKSHSAEKSSKGDSKVSSGFVS